MDNLLNIDEKDVEATQRVDYIFHSAKLVSEIADNRTQPVATQALRMSICTGRNSNRSKCPFDNLKKTNGPETIIESCGLTPKQLHRYYICLTKKRAVRFLNHIGHPTTLQEFKALTTARKYQKIFGRPVTTINVQNGGHLFTYCEILALVGWDHTLAIDL